MEKIEILFSSGGGGSSHCVDAVPYWRGWVHLPDYLRSDLHPHSEDSNGSELRSVSALSFTEEEIAHTLERLEAVSFGGEASDLEAFWKGWRLASYADLCRGPPRGTRDSVEGLHVPSGPQDSENRAGKHHWRNCMPGIEFFFKCVLQNINQFDLWPKGSNWSLPPCRKTFYW